jgi:hypothetical protein
VQCSAVQCSAVQCSAVQCSAVQCSAVTLGGGMSGGGTLGGGTAHVWLDTERDGRELPTVTTTVVGGINRSAESSAVPCSAPTK